MYSSGWLGVSLPRAFEVPKSSMFIRFGIRSISWCGENVLVISGRTY